MEIIGEDVMKNMLAGEAKNWCACDYNDESYAFHILPYITCVICKGVRKDEGIMKQDHYHCGACLKISQIG